MKTFGTSVSPAFSMGCDFRTIRPREKPTALEWRLPDALLHHSPSMGTISARYDCNRYAIPILARGASTCLLATSGEGHQRVESRNSNPDIAGRGVSLA